LNRPSTPKKKWDLTQESFDKLLSWLDADRDTAGRKYEEIRQRLIKILSSRGCTQAEELTDEAFNRVIRRLPEIEEDYQGDHALYFYGVANKLYLEWARKKANLTSVLPPAAAPDTDTDEKAFECLDECIQKLSKENRDLVLAYYLEEKGAKIDHRKQLAEHLGIALNALRIRAFRIRSELHSCLLECLQD
jgi:RNA polymerase sigma factor (sigma-70 family)